ALLHHLGKLKPGETKRLITQLGQDESIEKAMPKILTYRDENQIENSLQEFSGFWDEYLSKQQVKTPNADMNSMLNVHNPRQCYITKNWSRYLSLYQLGFGGRGIGFRDSSQDVMGILSNKPEEGKDLIVKLLHVQKQNGSAMHQFNPLTMVANEGDSREEEDRPKYYGDDHLWIILAASAYLKETGNLAFLDKMIPFYEKDKNNNPLEEGTVLEHLKRAIEFTHDNTGKHGLPLLGFADWNDTVNLKTGAESIFIANQYGCALLEMIDLLNHIGDKKSADKYKHYYEDMKKTVNKEAWDGEWYVRYFDYDGQPLGSKVNSEGKVYTNAQSWAVLSGFATPERAQQAMDSVNKHLNTKNGIKVSTPGYNGFDPNKGGVTTYPPGAKENGGIFLHTNPWVMIAETKVGNGDRAFEYYNQINPATKNDKIDEFECAPYNYPQNILGDEHPQFGLGRNSWLSGTSSWTYQAATKFILGIRPEYDSLTIDPCIPKSWDGFNATRVFRGAIYKIEVKNPNHVSKGVKSITVDGKPVDKVPAANSAGAEHKVIVELG
ncbi:MAG: glycosyl transferase, partial [Candidatus Margulisiibacteriota bacterium]